MTDVKPAGEGVPQNKGPGAPDPVPAPGRRAMTPTIKAAFDFAPVLVFFVTYLVAKKHNAPGAATHALDPGLMWATAVFIGATLISLAISYAIERKVHVLPLVTAVIVTVFGGLTLVFHDDRFIKMKPTIIYLLLAGGLMGGLLFNKIFLKQVLGTVFQLTEAGWRTLTMRWGFFFIALAVLNEVLRRVLSTDDWVLFKVWGLMGLIVVFSVWQALFISRRQAKSEKSGE